MYKSKTRIIVITFFILIISSLLINNNFAVSMLKLNNEVISWKVAITNDTKELKDTQEVVFKVEDNPNVAKGKIAPGLKAFATIEINLIGTNVPVDVITTINDDELYKSMVLSATIDGEKYNLGTVHTIDLEKGLVFNEKNGKKIITLELEWKENNNEIDTILGMTKNEIKIPITIEVKQHI